jgi:hypothetical protein
MNSEELISFLQKNPSDEVLLASDAEGNSFSSVDEVTKSYVLKDYDGGRTEEVFDAEDLVDETDPDEAVLEHFKPVLVIYPA